MYRLVYLKENAGNAGKVIAYKEFGRYQSIQEAAEARCVSGDLVFNGNEIVEDLSWLFEWEKENPECYAQRNIKAKTQIPVNALVL